MHRQKQRVASQSSIRDRNSLNLLNCNIERRAVITIEYPSEQDEEMPCHFAVARRPSVTLPHVVGFKAHVTAHLRHLTRVHTSSMYTPSQLSAPDRLTGRFIVRTASVLRRHIWNLSVQHELYETKHYRMCR